MYCHLPFTDFQVKPNGDVHGCCEDWLPTKLGNLRRESPEKIWHGQVARDIRSSILDGTFKYCTRCPYLPGPAGPVRPQARSSHPTTTDPPLRTLVLNHDRTCNLSCPSCRPTPNDRSTRDETLATHARIQSTSLLKMAQHLYVSGAGDPVASPLYWDLLCNHDLSHLAITLHTNGQLLDKNRLAEMGKNLDRLRQVGISIDAATPETYTTNRGSSWTRLWQNVQHVKSLKPAIELGAYYTVQANNYAELPRLSDHLAPHEFKWVNVFCLRNWGTYSKDEYRQRAVHYPSHPEHLKFLDVMASLKSNPIIILPHLPPTIPQEDLP